MAEAQDTDLDSFETLTKEESIGDQIQETYGSGIISENVFHCDTSKISSHNETLHQNETTEVPYKNNSSISSHKELNDKIRRLELQLSRMEQLNEQNSEEILRLRNENQSLKEELRKKDRNVPDKCVQVKKRPEGQETLQQQTPKEIGELQDPTVYGLNGEKCYVDFPAVSKYENAKSSTKEVVNVLDSNSNANQIKALQENGREKSNEKPQMETAGESSAKGHDGSSDKPQKETYGDSSADEQSDKTSEVDDNTSHKTMSPKRPLEENTTKQIHRTDEHVISLSSSKECLNEQAEHEHDKMNANKALMTSKKLVDRSVEEFPYASLNCSTDKDNSFRKVTSSPTETTSSKTDKSTTKRFSSKIKNFFSKKGKRQQMEDTHKLSTEGPAHETVSEDKNTKRLFSCGNFSWNNWEKQQVMNIDLLKVFFCNFAPCGFLAFLLMLLLEETNLCLAMVPRKLEKILYDKIVKDNVDVIKKSMKGVPIPAEEDSLKKMIKAMKKAIKHRMSELKNELKELDMVRCPLVLSTLEKIGYLRKEDIEDRTEKSAKEHFKKLERKCGILCYTTKEESHAISIVSLDGEVHLFDLQQRPLEPMSIKGNIVELYLYVLKTKKEEKEEENEEEKEEEKEEERKEEREEERKEKIEEDGKYVITTAWKDISSKECEKMYEDIHRKNLNRLFVQT